MIRFTSGDILRDDADALVNTVNCVGVTGRGIELQFKKAFPKNFEAYKKARQSGDIVPGKMFITEQENLVGPRFIVNFPTKRHWRGKSRVEDIESGLEAPRDAIKERNITSIAIPAPGSGLGGLNWSDVKTPWPHSSNSR
ncbi:MAG: macro domain-containing protein [Roseovarius sp.]|nr:macro domain-containing protein [Roseovarius sp.]